jgi:hypothetical protein
MAPDVISLISLDVDDNTRLWCVGVHIRGFLPFLNKGIGTAEIILHKSCTLCTLERCIT